MTTHLEKSHNQGREGTANHKILVVAILVWEPDRLSMHPHMNFFMVLIILRVYILWFVPKNENLDLDVFFELCKGRRYFGKSQIIREYREKRLFEHCKKITHN